jgi:hypothetical protein
MLALTLAVMCFAAPDAGDTAVARFGKPLKGLKATPVAEVLRSAKDGQAVRLEGKAETVCKNKGCWVTVRQGDASVHVTFEGYSFFIPKDSAGRNVALEGKVKVKAPDAAEVAHLKGEGAGKAAASRVSVEAYGVELRNAGTR